MWAERTHSKVLIVPWKSKRGSEICRSLLEFLRHKTASLTGAFPAVRIWNLLFLKQNAPSSTQTVPHCFSILYQPAESEPWASQGRTLGILYQVTGREKPQISELWNSQSCGISFGILQFYYKMIRWNSLWECVQGKSLWLSSGLSFTFNILTASKLLRNSKPASKGYYERWFKSSITVYMGHLRKERQMLFVF